MRARRAHNKRYLGAKGENDGARLIGNENAGGVLAPIRKLSVRVKAVSPLRSRLRFASARQVATAVQKASGIRIRRGNCGL